MPAPALLTEGSIPKRLFALALPILIGNVLQSLNVSINMIWIGHGLGETALAAASNASMVLFLLLSAVFGVGMAASILIGQRIGAKDLLGAKRVFCTGAGFFLGLSLLLTVLGYLSVPTILAILSTPPAALAQARIYLKLLFLDIPPLYGFIFLSMSLRGAGDAKTPFVFMLLNVVLDAGLNPLLIFGLGPWSGLGIAGSASASVIAQSLALLALVITLHRRQHPLLPRRHELGQLRPARSILKQLIGKGLPMGLQMICISCAALLMLSFVNAYGVATTAAYTAAMQLWTYVQMPAMSIGVGVSAMVAQNVGAGQWSRVSRITCWGLVYSVLLTAALVGTIQILGGLILQWFLPMGQNAILAICLHLNAIVLWTFIPFSVTFILLGVIRSTGAVWPPLIILMISLWLLRLPFILWLRPVLGSDAIWWSFTLSALASAALAMLYYRYGHWKRASMAY